MITYWILIIHQLLLVLKINIIIPIKKWDINTRYTVICEEHHNNINKIGPKYGIIDSTFNITVIPQYDIWPRDNIWPKNPSTNDRLNNNNPENHNIFNIDSK